MIRVFPYYCVVEKKNYLWIIYTASAVLNTLHLPDLPKGNYRMRAGERTASLLIQ